MWTLQAKVFSPSAAFSRLWGDSRTVGLAGMERQTIIREEDLNLEEVTFMNEMPEFPGTLPCWLTDSGSCNQKKKLF